MPLVNRILSARSRCSAGRWGNFAPPAASPLQRTLCMRNDGHCLHAQTQLPWEQKGRSRRHHHHLYHHEQQQLRLQDLFRFLVQLLLILAESTGCMTLARGGLKACRCPQVVLWQMGFERERMVLVVFVFVGHHCVLRDLNLDNFLGCCLNHG